jgi:hypothetical protein
VSGPRDFQDPHYVRWRNAVYRRDKWACRMPGCPGLSKTLNAHHIRRWANYPALRYVKANGITLCKGCHDRVCGREEEFEGLFASLASPPKADVTLDLLRDRYGLRPRQDPE